MESKNNEMNKNSKMDTEYSEQVLKNIKYWMRKCNITQKELGSCLEKNQSQISKIMNNDTKMTVEDLYKISRALNIKVTEILNPIDYNKVKKTEDSELLKISPSKAAFKGLMGEYNFYCYRTISREKGFLKGTLKLSEVNRENGDYCHASLYLKTGKNDKAGKPIVKEYEGRMVISLFMQSCFIEMYSEKYADCAYLNFHHMYLGEDDFECAIAGCMTTSAGENKRPVFLKAIIARKELTDQELENLSGLIRMNSRVIRISDQDFEQLKKEIPEDILKNFEEKRYYETDESHIRGINKSTWITKLRKMSINDKYIKVSAKTDEILFGYFKNLINEKKKEL